MLLLYLLLGSSSLSGALLADARSIYVPPSQHIPASEDLEPDLFYDIKPSDLNKYLHPSAVYTHDRIDCGDGEPIISSGKPIGCFFINSRTHVDRAVHVLGLTKKIMGDISYTESHLRKRGGFSFGRHHCHNSGVYSYIDALHAASAVPCKAMDEMAGRFFYSASFTISELSDGSKIYASGAESVQIRHDYFFMSFDADGGLPLSFKGECKRYLDRILGAEGVEGLCVGGSGVDSRGGWLDGSNDGEDSSRVFRIGVDPNLVDKDSS